MNPLGFELLISFGFFAALTSLHSCTPTRIVPVRVRTVPTKFLWWLPALLIVPTLTAFAQDQRQFIVRPSIKPTFGTTTTPSGLKSSALIAPSEAPFQLITGPLDLCNKAGEVLDVCEENHPIFITGTTGNDPLATEQWQLAAMKATEAWNISTGSSQVVVAVLDTGIDLSHPDLSDNIWSNPNEISGNGIDDDHNGIIDDVHGASMLAGGGEPQDDNFHGTHVSGIIGASGNNGLGISGVNWRVKLLAVKALDKYGSGTVFEALKGLQYLLTLKRDQGVPIVAINASWGTPFFSQSLKDVIQALGNEGVVVVTAAGNSGEDVGIHPLYPAALGLSNVITVAATGADGRLPQFSNFNPTLVRIAAPGVRILSTSLAGGYVAASGTSMAAPQVTGALALMKSVRPDLSGVELSQILLANQPAQSALIGAVEGGRALDIESALFAASEGRALPAPPPVAPIATPIAGNFQDDSDLPVTVSYLGLTAGSASFNVSIPSMAVLYPTVVISHRRCRIAPFLSITGQTSVTIRLPRGSSQVALRVKTSAGGFSQAGALVKSSSARNRAQVGICADIRKRVALSEDI